MTDTSKRFWLSRRSLLASLATIPTLFTAAPSNAVETSGCDAAAPSSPRP